MTEPLPEPEMNVQPPEIVESRPPASGEPPAALPPGLGDLAQEVRRLGRELFKLNRGTEQNQALFETALEELQVLTERLAQLPDLREETAFQAKAQLCRELFHLADVLQTSRISAEEIAAEMERDGCQVGRWIEKLPAVRRQREAVLKAANRIRQWHEGQRLLEQRLLDILQTAGVSPIETVGGRFDPERHRAVSVMVRLDVPAGTVVSEELRGYTLEGRVLRYAEVVVARHE